MFAGTDATLGLATFNLGDVKRRKKLHLEERHFANIAHWEKTFAGTKWLTYLYSIHWLSESLITILKAQNRPQVVSPE